MKVTLDIEDLLELPIDERHIISLVEDAEVLDYLVEKYSHNRDVLIAVIHNGYTSATTLEKILNNMVVNNWKWDWLLRKFSHHRNISDKTLEKVQKLIWGE